ncbi:MAG: dephospho-CoA kinase [Solitalea-like symbiont of Tyrophagus putrescentiae]
MLKVGLTGGIGAGKTTVAKIFMSLGVPVFFSDVVAKKLQTIDLKVIYLLKEAFGSHIYRDDGSVNSKLLADQVFKNAKKLETLNNIVHPFVIDNFDKWILNQSAKYVIKESALPFSIGKYNLKNDINILVSARKDIRIERVKKRNKLTYEEIINRIDSQINFEDYINFADFIIYNNKEALIPQVMNIHNTIISK